MVPGRSANQATPKAAATTQRMKKRTRIMASVLCLVGSGGGSEQRRFEPLHDVVGGCPRIGIVEPRLERVARRALKRCELLHRAAKIALVEQGLGAGENGARGIAGRCFVNPL